MLDDLFMTILDMTKTGSIVILVVILARLLLRRAPKVFSYALWAVVLLRLLCPVSFGASTVSLIPEIASVADTYSLKDEPISVLEAGNAAYQAVGDALNGGLGVQHIHTTELEPDGTYRVVTTDWYSVWILFGQYVWLVGVAWMLLHSLISYRKLRKQIEIAIPLRDNLYLADDLESPFVVGLVHPKIYLPSNLSQREYDYIILHEQHHIRRGDHIIKALSFLALCLHWFNPLVWLAFHLASKDMEMSCDEAVVRRMGESIRADYSASLLTLATGRRIIAGTPLAFGEGDPKGRIRNLAKWKKPAVWVLILAVLICLILGVCLMTDRSIRESQHVGVTYYYGEVNEQTDSVIQVMCHDGNQRTFHYEADNEDIPDDLTGRQVRIRARQQEVRGNLIATSAEEVPDIRFDSLDEAIQTVILAHHSSGGDPEVLNCASFYTFASEGSGPAGSGKVQLVREYGIVYHQGYRLDDGQLVEDGGCNVPTVLTFHVDDDGSYILAEYWEPRDGTYYPDDIRAKYPPFVWPDTQKNLFEQKIAIFRQVMEGFHVGPEVVVDHLITDICDRERWAGSFDDLMLMCQLQWELLSYYGEETLDYCFDQFENGGQNGTRGRVMAQVCSEVLDSMGQDAAWSAEASGQDWFDSYIAAHPRTNWGISLKAENAAPNGARITMTQEGGYLPNRLFYGDDFSIQRYDENAGWINVEPASGVAWRSIAYNVPLNNSVTWNVEWSAIYGTLEPGCYRFCKGVFEHHAPGDNDFATFYAEFEIS